MAQNFKNSRRVLKLVFPGGIAQIHKKPIKAAEIMKKNPRHCVARPDVFQNPWLVVHPESVLKPGHVFYVVPYYTLYGLIKKNKCQTLDFPSPSPQQDFLPPYKGNAFSPAREPCVEHEAMQISNHCIHDHDMIERHFREMMKEKCPTSAGARPKIDCKYEDWQEGVIFRRSVLSHSISEHHSNDSPNKLFPVEHCRTDFTVKESEQRSSFNSHLGMIDQHQLPKEKQSLRMALRHGSHKAVMQQKPVFKSQSEHERTFNSPNKVYPVQEEPTPEIHVNSRFITVETIQQDGDSPKKRYPVERWERTISYKFHQQSKQQSSVRCPKESDQQIPVRSFVQSRPASSSEIACGGEQLAVAIPEGHKGPGGSAPPDRKTLKSCLKKENSAKKRDFRVTFAPPGEDEGKLILQVFEFERTDSF